jgi:hypothetical protein
MELTLIILTIIIYFDNHFLTESEIKTREIKRKGFYILCTDRRLKQILPLYNKKINIASDSLILKSKFPIIDKYNKNIKQ